MEQYLEAGKVATAHGVRGDLRVESWCDSPKVLAELKCIYIGKEKTAYKVQKGSVHRGMALLHLEGIEDRDAALARRIKPFMPTDPSFLLPRVPILLPI